MKSVPKKLSRSGGVPKNKLVERGFFTETNSPVWNLLCRVERKLSQQYNNNQEISRNLNMMSREMVIYCVSDFRHFFNNSFIFYLYNRHSVTHTLMLVYTYFLLSCFVISTCADKNRPLVWISVQLKHYFWQFIWTTFLHLVTKKHHKSLQNGDFSWLFTEATVTLNLTAIIH